MRKILLVALTAAAMVSCSENEGFENESTMNRIKFGTVVKTGTKTLVATTENFSKFTVSAYKTTDDMGGTVQLNTGFMDDIEVDKSSGEWKYKGDYYWPVSGKLQFFATSPAQTLDITTAAGYPKFEYAVKAVDSQEDLVAANVINQVKSESAISLAPSTIFLCFSPAFVLFHQPRLLLPRLSRSTGENGAIRYRLKYRLTKFQPT